jgi:hypothetical protein
MPLLRSRARVHQARRRFLFKVFFPAMGLLATAFWILRLLEG